MWGLTFSGAGGEPGVGRVPDKGCFRPSTVDAHGIGPRATCTLCAAPTGIGRYMGHSPEVIGRHPNEFVTLRIARYRETPTLPRRLVCVRPAYAERVMGVRAQKLSHANRNE